MLISHINFKTIAVEREFLRNTRQRLGCPWSLNPHYGLSQDHFRGQKLTDSPQFATAMAGYGC